MSNANRLLQVVDGQRRPGLLAAFSAPSSAQGGPTVTIGYTQLNGVADDWTQHHVVFSNPGTEEQAIKAGRYDEWLKIVNDPRYVMHQMKRGLPAQGPASGDVAAFEAVREANRNIEPVSGGVLPHRSGSDQTPKFSSNVAHQH